jgi:hypothetical protein
VQIDTEKWGGEGEFTQKLIDRLRELETVAFLRVEDAPATRSEADFNFISNEIYVAFTLRDSARRGGPLGFLRRRTPPEPTMTIDTLAAALSGMPDVGAPDYQDQGMLQYLRTERIVPPYQTRGYKLVELIRVYEVASPAS